MLKNLFEKLNLSCKYYIDINFDKKTKDYCIFSFENSKELDKYFKNKKHRIRLLDDKYSFDDCPEGIAVIPILSNLLPIAWYFDAEIKVNELDKTFYNAANNIKKSYKQMFPNIEFKGKLTVKNIVDYSYEPTDEYISLFSMGVDSLDTVCNNYEKNLHLVTLYGSDIPLNQKEGWNNLVTKIEKFSHSINFENSFIKSNFKSYLNGSELNKEIKDKVPSSWWHQFQHGIAILAHAAIIAYFRKSKAILIASSHSPAEAKYFNKPIMSCASSPLIDNEFKFAGCYVIHDGYNKERVDKIRNIISFSRKHDVNVEMRVCFVSRKGDNCSVCDKCSRCILTLVSEGENPENYGFKIEEDTYINIYKNIEQVANGINRKGWNYTEFKVFDWIEIQKNFLKNKEKWENDDNFNWILDYDFTKIKK